MWDEFVAGWLEMPLWAQIGVGFFVFTFVVMLVEPVVTRRKYAGRLKVLASAAGTSTTSSDAFTEWFSTTVDGRPFEVRRELRVRSRGGSYRGPTGHLLITATPLAGSRWKLQQVDITPGRVPKWLGGPPRVTGDAAFDGRFLVKLDSPPVREDWLDAPTRAAVTAFFDTPAASGPLWIRDQQVQHLVTDSWKTLAPEELNALLRQQAALATALERTAGWRGPTS